MELDTYLDNVDYKSLETYVPSDFALTFMNFIKLVNGEQGESNKTPPVHLKMLDKLANGKKYIANLCYRGSGKTTLFMEYLAPYLGVFRHLPGFGELDSMLYISDSMDNGVKSARKNIEFRYNNSEFLQEWLPKAKFSENYIEFTNKEGLVFGIKLFGAKSGLRGTKIFGKRPKLAVLDDLVSDEDARSKVAMEAIKDTVYKGVNHALDPTRSKVIFNGTPFNKDDILVDAVESGAWDVNVWPVCEKFPCDEEEFRGAWEDRFSYAYVKEQYEMASKTKKIDAFNQELMLRLSSEEERLIQEGDINWFDRKALLDNKHNFNFYITTDFAVSTKQSADFSVISVWAYSPNADWFWVDGFCGKETLDKVIDRLFKFCQEYGPQAVGVEVTGQQGGFIPWIQKEMFSKNIWFTLASSNNGSAPGIRPSTDKLARLNLVVPWFKSGRFHFPKQMRESVIMGTFMEQIRLATITRIKGKDDCLDTISMLAALNPWKPTQGTPRRLDNDETVWEDPPEPASSSLKSYLV